MNKRKVTLVIVLIIFIVGALSVVKLTRENSSLRQEIRGLKEDPSKLTKDETAKIIDLVKKLVILPEGEEPVLATVTDKEKLKDQPLFAKAENGDKILIYSKAQKAYIYNPSKNVIVDVVPVNVGDGTITITGTDENNLLKVALLNGSKTVGSTALLERRIMEKKVVGLSIVSKATAKTSDYQKTLVIDLSGKRAEQAIQLAHLVGGSVATESAEEKPANAEILVILGADFK